MRFDLIPVVDHYRDVFGQIKRKKLCIRAMFQSMREPVKERPVSLKSDVVWELYYFLVKTNPPVIFLNKKDENGFWNEEVLYVRDIELINYDCFFNGFRIDDIQFGNSSSKKEGVRVFYTDKLSYLIRGMGYGGYK